MEITISDKAKHYLKSKDNVVTLVIRTTGGGWCGTVQVPEMVFKVPAAPEKYLNVNIDGAQIYISKTAAIGTNHIHFELKGVSIFKTLVAQGTIYPKV